MHIYVYVYMHNKYIYVYIYTHIYCEQNDPCSGCYQFVSRAPNVLCLPAFQRHAAKAQLLFLEVGTWANSALANGPFKYCGVYVRCIPV